jgi:hypothetical protein
MISMQIMPDIEKNPLVLHRDECPPSDWQFGKMQRIVTGGKGGVANVHVAKTQNLPHFSILATMKYIMSYRGLA